MGAWLQVRQPKLLKGACRIKSAWPWQAATLVVIVGLATVQGSSVASDRGFNWTPAKVVLAIFLFLAAGLCEIGGGWLVWQVHLPRLLLLPQGTYSVCCECLHFPAYKGALLF